MYDLQHPAAVYAATRPLETRQDRPSFPVAGRHTRVCDMNAHTFGFPPAAVYLYACTCGQGRVPRRDRFNQETFALTHTMMRADEPRDRPRNRAVLVRAG